jgi:HD-GYP domain-containing protein (c-di-GMP phosphodiesterase class II)
MEHTLHDLLRLLRDTASNQEFSVLAKTITHQSYLVTRAETIQLYTYSPEKETFTNVADHAIIPFKIDLNSLITGTPWLMAELNKGETVHLTRSDNILKKHQDYLYNSDIYFFPLLNRQKQLVGVLNLGYERAITSEQYDKHAFLRELLSFAEIAKDNIDKIQQQKDMLNAFVTLIASAIDTKSPYTGGHCQRVPALTKMLAEVADKDTHYYRNFSMTKPQWEELNLAAWLHDCGKVTTPEYVVDKATKLETIYDRIHEVRMRFELLKTQAEADYWQGVALGGDESQLKATLTQTQHSLDEDFAFVAKCNIGGEYMSDEDVARLETIAQKQWKRTLDDQLGISWIEAQRAGEKQPLPVMENLIADKQVHQVKWQTNNNPKNTWQEPFVLQPGEYQYNRGELYNLSIRGGTLNSEERFMINDHIVQTITMLQRLPYPEHLKNVPDIAGGHHERMDGKGYPRGLHEEELSVQARVMAIADVFEALTSNDRPYKQAKTIDESISIMTKMATSGHIDPKLYLLFLEQDVYQKYADMFLEKFQHSDIDKEEHIKTVKAYMKQQF